MRASSALAASAGTTRPPSASTAMMPSSSATGTCLKRGGRPSSANSMLALLARRDRRARPADGQHAVVQRGVVQAVGQVVGQIVVADRLAGGERAVAEHQEGLAALHALDLPRQRLEERRRPHDRIAQARFDQRLLEGQLGLLEGQQRLLHADAPTAARPGARRRPARRPAHADGPGGRWPRRRAARRCATPGRTPARRSVRRESRRAPARPGRTRRRSAASAPGQQPRAVVGRQLPADAGARAHEAHHLVTAPHQRAHRGPADGAGGTEHEHALRHQGARPARRLCCGFRAAGRAAGGLARFQVAVRLRHLGQRVALVDADLHLRRCPPPRTGRRPWPAWIRAWRCA